MNLHALLTAADATAGYTNTGVVSRVAPEVEGVLMPPLGLLLGRIDFGSLFYVLDSSKGMPPSLTEAKAQGVPVIAYGQLINDVIGFLIVGLAVFLLVKQVNRIKSAVETPDPDAPTTRECPFCMSTISKLATRCPQCTSEVVSG